MYQMLQGLSFMHSRGVVHLDLSCENVLLSDSGEVKIIDFGQARFVEYERDSKGQPQRKRFSGIKPGKKGYKDPDIFRGATFDGVAADIWSCGVIIFIVLFGFPPYTSPHPSDRFFQKLIQGKLPTIYKDYNRMTNRNVSEAAAKLISGMCAARPRRLTLEQVLAHEWFNDCDIAQQYRAVS